MKVELLQESTRHNPKFDRTKEVTPENHPLVKLPVGTVVEGPDAYQLCLTDPPMAKPADQEAASKVASIKPPAEETTFTLPDPAKHPNE